MVCKKKCNDIFANLPISVISVQIAYPVASTLKGIGVCLNFHGLPSRIQGIMKDRNISTSSHSISFSCFMRRVTRGLNYKAMHFL